MVYVGRDSGFDAEPVIGPAKRPDPLASPRNDGVWKTPLSLGLAAAGGFGIVDRTEPARALADMHLDFCVPAAGRLVIDALAGAVDVALDGAVRRGRHRARGRGQ